MIGRTTILNEICDIKKGEQLNKDDLMRLEIILV
jgi:hypothetical protein